jgi:L-ribulokinase
VIVAGVDFGTRSVRVSLVDSERGMLQSGVCEYPLHRRRDDPEYATQSHRDQMNALASASKQALAKAGLAGDDVRAIAVDTTGSSVVPVGADMEPLDDYYMWCDHRAKGEAAEITQAAHRTCLEAIHWCGGTYSSEWGFSKVLHWLRHNPDRRHEFASAFEHCDVAVATLCGIADPGEVTRSVCAMGHKWMWNRSLGGLPPEEFLVSVDPLFEGVRAKLDSRYATSDTVAGGLSSSWAVTLGLSPDIPVPVGALDAHWDAIGAGCRNRDVVNVIGTSTCIIGITRETRLIPGVCGVVPGSVHPSHTGVEAGLSATGDIFGSIARRAGRSVTELSRAIEAYRPGQTGLLRLTWDNGDRTVLVNPNLRGITLGWDLQHTPEDEFFAAIEGSAFHTRIILDRMAEYGAMIDRVINGGGVPQNCPALNQVYANVLGRPVLVPNRDTTGLGSAIFAFVAAGAFPTVEDAQDRMCSPYDVYHPTEEGRQVYDELYSLYRRLYFEFGRPAGTAFGDVLPSLMRIASAQRGTRACRGWRNERERDNAGESLRESRAPRQGG